MDEKNIKLIIAYDGSHYHGWQQQKNGITIQEAIEEKISIMVGEPVKLIASGRTDAGVHAIGQVCNFKTRSNIRHETIKKGLNSILPKDILVKDADLVPLAFHARYSAKSKSYEYRILNRKDPDIFQQNYLWHVPIPLNTKEMAKCLSLLIGRHDFSSFKSSGSGNKNPIRSIIGAELYCPEDGVMRFVIKADGFLRHMVRNIVGTIVQAGLGKMDVDRFEFIFKSRDRRLAGINAPPQGLFLMEVRY